MIVKTTPDAWTAAQLYGRLKEPKHKDQIMRLLRLFVDGEAIRANDAAKQTKASARSGNDRGATK